MPGKTVSPGPRGRFTTFRTIVAYDDEWSGNDLTERHAFTQAIRLLPASPSVRYFGFPWGKLIDQLQSGQKAGKHLLGMLSDSKKLLGEYRNVVTVCQHRELLKHQDLFAAAGITHLFWPHISPGQKSLPNFKHIGVHPFPAMPFPRPATLPHKTERSHLLSCPEAGMWKEASYEPVYRQLNTDSRVTIISGDVSTAGHEHAGQGAIAVHRASWRILQDSHFSLCFNAGPAWLWTALHCGAIPVFPDRIPPLPGNPALWEQASVCCATGQKAIDELPGRLEQMAGNGALLELKRRALRQLRLLYGTDCFIYDIIQLLVSLVESPAEESTAQPCLSYGRLNDLAIQIVQGSDAGLTTRADVFTLGCCSRILANPVIFLKHYQESGPFRLACRKAFAACSEVNRQQLRQSLAIKGLTLSGCDANTVPGETAAW